MSELLPHLAQVADDIAVVRSMHTEQFNHAPAQILLNTGFERVGRPSLGSWLSYGLGSDELERPASSSACLPQGPASACNVCAHDPCVAGEALERVGISHLAGRQISQLSGGQQQRVFLARALAQDARLYFMDEPFAAVDAATEQAIVALLKELNEAGKTCLVVHHDLATVSRYFDWLVLLNMRVVAAGPTEEVFTRENLHKTYGGKLSVLEDVADRLRHVGR